MSKFRIIPKLEIKGKNVVKGIRMEGLRIVGQPETMSKKYIDLGADELIFLDTVASLYNRNQLVELVSETSVNCSIPLLVGGGLRSVCDVKKILRAGADKVSLNTSAHQSLEIIGQVAEEFGSQSIVASVQAKCKGENKWDAYYLNGRENSKRDVVQWCKELCDRGIGEILLTSVDNDGTRYGLDQFLIEAVLNTVEVPVIVSGGVGSIDDILWAASAGASGVALSHLLHFDKASIPQLKFELAKKGFDVRLPELLGTEV